MKRENVKKPIPSRAHHDQNVVGPWPGNDIVPDTDSIPFPDEAILGSIPDRFEQQVAQYPNRMAIKSRGRMYTYDEVNRSANRTAHAVLGHNSEGEKAVALFLEHGASPVIALLGVLKSGNMYVPIDPDLPSERISYMFGDSQAKLVITNDKNLSAVQRFVSDTMTIINIDALGDEFSERDPLLPLKPDTLAAVIYTSGSAGQPKGVLSTHCNVLHAIKLRTNHHRICSDDRIALLCSFSFGASRGEIFGALLNGAAVFPFDISPFHPEEEGLSNLADWLIREKITATSFVPTVFRHFVEALTGDEAFPDLHIIVLGGETITRRDLSLFSQHFSDHALLRLSFGMSEACSAVTIVFVDTTTEIHGDIVPVGYPLEDFEILLLNEDGEEVGYDRVGEIAVKSRYLSPGYWRKPELTAECFMSCPGEEGLRMYRTGDLGRMSPDGCLFHLGRKDLQVKVRGYRIEIAEIERALLSIDDVSHAAVVVHPHAHGDKRLAAYIECDKTSRPTITSMRAVLKERLPEYMIPFYFVFVDKLPVTPSGKIDRQALPVPDASRPEIDTPFIEPRTAMEKRLSDIWGDILDISPIGIRDDFFDLGGHSLSAAQVFAHIEGIFRKRLPVSVLFEAPTIEKLAAVLWEEVEVENRSMIVPIQTEGAKLPFFCVHTLTGDVVAYGELARHLGQDQPFYGIRARGLDGKLKPHTEIETMAAQYINEMRRVQPEGPYFLGGMCFGGVVAFEMAQQLHAQGQEIGLLTLFDTPCPPFYFIRHILFQLRRYSWHLKEEALGAIRRVSGHSTVPGKRSLAHRLVSLRTTIRVLRVDRANHCALQKYHPQVYPGRIVHFFRSQYWSRQSQDLRMEWEKYAAGGVEIQTNPGDHHTMLREPHVRSLAEKLRGYLERAQSG